MKPRKTRRILHFDNMVFSNTLWHGVFFVRTVGSRKPRGMKARKYIYVHKYEGGQAEMEFDTRKQAYAWAKGLRKLYKISQEE